MVLILIAVSIIACVLVYFTNRLNMHGFAVAFTLVIVGDILYPAVFFFSGGINGPTTYFVLTITLLFLLTKGKTLLILLITHCIAILGCFYIATVNPDLIAQISIEQKTLNDLTAIFVSGLLLGVVIIYQYKLFNYEQEKVENANIRLNKQDILLRSMNEASTILLSADNSEFSESFNSGISCIAGGINASKISLWQISDFEGENTYNKIYEWEKTKGLIADSELYSDEDALAEYIASQDKKLGSDEPVKWSLNSVEGKTTAFSSKQVLRPFSLYLYLYPIITGELSASLI